MTETNYDRLRTPMPEKIIIHGDHEARAFIETINDLSREGIMDPIVAFKRLLLRALILDSQINQRLLGVDDAIKFSSDHIAVVSENEKAEPYEMLISIGHPYIQALAPYHWYEYSDVRAVNSAGMIASAVTIYIEARLKESFKGLCKELQAVRFGNASTRQSDDVLEAYYTVFNSTPDVTNPSVIEAKESLLGKGLGEYRQAFWIMIFKACLGGAILYGCFKFVFG